jgi:hypothetical protein
MKKKCLVSFAFEHHDEGELDGRAKIKLCDMKDDLIHICTYIGSPLIKEAFLLIHLVAATLCLSPFFSFLLAFREVYHISAIHQIVILSNSFSSSSLYVSISLVYLLIEKQITITDHH